MPMTKKDFIALADVMKGTRPPMGDEESQGQWSVDVTALADFCQSRNPWFNRQRWMDYINGLCGPNGGEVRDRDEDDNDQPGHHLWTGDH